MSLISGIISKPRHLMIVHHIYPLAEPRVEREALALVNHGYEVDVICLRNPGEPESDVAKGVNVFRMPVRRDKRRGMAMQMMEYLIFLLLAGFKAASLQRTRKYTSVQVHNLPDFLVFAALIPKLSGARVILDLHDLMPEFYCVRFKSGMDSLPARLVLLQERLSCRFADHVITVTELWRQTLIQRGLPSSKVSVVMNLPDERVFRQPATEVPPEPLEGSFRLIYHGSVTYRYGLDLIVRAVDKLRADLPGIHFECYGGGDFRPNLIALAEELGLQEHTTFHLAVALEELPNRIRRAQAGVVPHRRDLFTDSLLPTKLMEYVALGVPVIASRTTVVSSYFDEDMLQFFTAEDIQDLADKILDLYNRPERRQQLIQNAERFNQQYHWSTMAASYATLVDRLIGRGMNHPPMEPSTIPEQSR